MSIIAEGLAEFRDRGYGTGHGPATVRVGLTARHAHLAVNAAITWCQLMLDTLVDPRALGGGETKQPHDRESVLGCLRTRPPRLISVWSLARLFRHPTVVL